MNSLLPKLFLRIASLGADRDDSEEIKLQKSLLVLCTFPFMMAGTGWGLVYIYYGEIAAGIIPLSYSVFSFFSVIYFAISHRYKIFRFSQLLLILLLPVALMFALGGFISGSAVIIWSLICPLGAMLFDQQQNAPRWFIAFFLLVFISGLLQPWVSFHNNLPPSLINFLFIMNLTAVGALIFWMVYYFVGKKNFFQERSEDLLRNILPEEIAEELKEKGHAEARYFDAATVMFTDFKGFTKISERLTPTELVAEINMLFKSFDHIISKYNIEKIKTIGDSYMCAGGLPVATHTHATDIVNAALEFRNFMQQHLDERRKADKASFEIRIGVHTGPVVAGIVGDTKFSYDIWGDTVNTASRMESSGEAGKVNISGATYELIKDKFNCTYRGKIKAKNKGEIDMYFVDSSLLVASAVAPISQNDSQPPENEVLKGIS
jgi:guanylate cyclase